MTLHRMLLLAIALGTAVLGARAADVELLGQTAPWRVWVVLGPRVERGPDGQPTCRIARRGRSPQIVPFAAENGWTTTPPAADWTTARCDDRLWGRYAYDLHDFVGSLGRAVWQTDQQPLALYLRSRFGVTDPALATDVRVTIEYIGGAVVYVNGTEVGRGDLPAGPLTPYTLATDYPVAAYTTEDGTTPLPVLQLPNAPEARWMDRYKLRVRTLTVTVPARLLVQGGNVIAVEVRRAALAGPVGQSADWCHLAVPSLRVFSASRAGVVPYSEAFQGARVWSAEPVEEVTDSPATRNLLAFGWGCPSLRANAVKGLDAANPYDPVLPVRILVPRNGVGHGQVVASDAAGIQELRASLGGWRGPDGVTLPDAAVRIFYARQGMNHWCDELADAPPIGAKSVPVWLEVTAPKDQAAGWYTTTLALAVNGVKRAVPVQVFVSPFTAPDAKDFRSFVMGIHSPEALCNTYKVKPWSPEHFALIERSLAMLGQMGSDALIVPVIKGGHMGHQTGLIRWVKTADGVKPEFSAFRKYLDLWTKYCGTPKAIILYVWSAESSSENAMAYEGTQIPIRPGPRRQALAVTCWDPATGETSDLPAPQYQEEGAEAFWKPMLDGVHDIVVNERGWSERTILLGLGSDTRPSMNSGAAFHAWAPYARWDIYSHFSGDPGSFFYRGPKPAGAAPGKLIALGNLEVGLKEAPSQCFAARELSFTDDTLEYLRSAVHRGAMTDTASPLAYRVLPETYGALGRLSRVGLDFWPGVSNYATPIWGTCPVRLAWNAPAGPAPTVRLALLREALQDFEARLAITDRMAALSAEQQKPYQDLLNDYSRRVAFGEAFLSQAELQMDWSGYAAQLHDAAAELAGVKTDAAWNRPPQP